MQPEIKSYEDIRGKTVVVDAPDTAFGLLLYKMLDVKGVKKGEYEVKARRRHAAADRGDAQGQEPCRRDAQSAVLDPRPSGQD